MTTVSITDISFWQYGYKDPTKGDWTITRYVDFKKMKSMADATIIRAGQNTWVDRTFAISWKAAKEAGLPRGSYWFYDSRSDPKKQAELWVQTLGNDLGELPLWADFEERYGGTFAGWRNWKVFLERIKQLLPKKELGIYTAFYYWRDNAPTTSTDLGYFKQYPLWVANYGVTKPAVPLPWTEWLIWQYTDKGNGPAYGVISQQIDLNHFAGDRAAFRKRFNLDAAPPVEPPPPPPPPPQKTESVIDLNVYAESSAASAVAGQLSHGDKVEIVGSTADFWRIQQGWARKSVFVTTAPPNQPFPISARTNTALNIRSEPIIGGNNIVGVAGTDTVLLIDEIVKSGSDIWGKHSRGWSCLYIQSINRYFTNITNFSGLQIGVYTPPTKERLFYRLAHDVENPRYNYRARHHLSDWSHSKTVGYPQTFPIRGGNGIVELSPAWVRFFDIINTPAAQTYIRTFDMGWYNKGNWPQVRQLSWGGNVVEIDRIEGDRAYLANVYYNNEAPPDIRRPASEWYDTNIIHYFSVVYPDGKVSGPPVGPVRTFIIARDRTEKLWVPLREIIRVPGPALFFPSGTAVKVP